MSNDSWINGDKSKNLMAQNFSFVFYILLSLYNETYLSLYSSKTLISLRNEYDRLWLDIMSNGCWIMINLTAQKYLKKIWILQSIFVIQWNFYVFIFFSQNFISGCNNYNWVVDYSVIIAKWINGKSKI